MSSISSTCSEMDTSFCVSSEESLLGTSSMSTSCLPSSTCTSDADSIALCGKRLLCCKFILVTIILGASNESMGESSINSSSSGITSCNIEESPNSSDDDIDADDADESIVGDPFAVPLYEGADLSIFDSYFLAFQFSVRHCLTSTELLNLLRVHVPTSAKVAKSLYRLKKYFLQLFPHAKCTTHRYCSCLLKMKRGIVQPVLLPVAVMVGRWKNLYPSLLDHSSRISLKVIMLQ